MHCVRHPDRSTALRCSRCDRPACPDCLRPASVGFHCVDCVAQAGRDSRARTPSPTVRRPVVVPVLIALNVAIFAVTAEQARSVQYNVDSQLWQDWALLPMRAAVNGTWWQLLTTGFLHIGPLHLLANMFSLWMIGRDMEALLGRVRFLGVYLAGLVGGSAAVVLLGNAGVAVAGASTAVWGLLGGVLVVLLRLRRNLSTVIGMIVINLGISFLPGISLIGHLGGFVAGAAATAALVYAPARHRTLWQAGAFVAIAVVLALAVTARGAALSSGTVG
jgi:membrane associated rhomboid family serine protease